MPSALDGTPLVLMERPGQFSGLLEHPFDAYRRLRNADPVYAIPAAGGEDTEIYLVTGYEAARQAHLHPDLSVERMKARVIRRYQHALPDMFVFPGGRKSISSVDPPAHTRLRKIAIKAFTPRRVAQLQASTVETARQLVKSFRRGTTFDLVKDFAEPFPAIVIAQLLGLPTEDRDEFRFHASQVFVQMGQTSPSAAMRSLSWLSDYLREHIAQRRTSRRDDVLSTLAANHEEGTLDEEEILGMAILLLTAGHETTTNLIGSGFLHLFRFPEELDRLRRQPELVEGAVEELLRFDPPLQTNFRVATTDLEIDGAPVAKGGFVVIVIGAANRDPAQFSDPERLDIGREKNDHLTFGVGRHFCIGAALARMEGRVALRVLLDTFETMRPVTLSPARRPSLILRGPATLPVLV